MHLPASTAPDVLVLAGDLGGTKILLELSRGKGGSLEVAFARRYAAAQYASFESVLRAFLDEFSASGATRLEIDRACFGVAGPVAGGRVKLTNLPWMIDADELARHFRIGSVQLVNDFAAAAHGIDHVRPDALVTLQAGEHAERGTRAILGAGTGYGGAYSVWTGAGYQVIGGEGGHIGFAPADESQAALWRDIGSREGRVSVEHVVSGPGILRIYDFLRRTAPLTESAALRAALHAGAGPEAISQHALAAGDRLALAALDMFIRCYGAAAGDHALCLSARGGVYIAGGIAAQILPRLAAGEFIAAFNAKGMHTALMAAIPVYIVTDPGLGLLGARQLAAREPDDPRPALL